MSSGKEKAPTLDVQAVGDDQATVLDEGDNLGVSPNSHGAGANQSFPELPYLAVKNILKHIGADAKENDFDEAFVFMKKKDENKIDSVVNPVQNEILKCRLISKIWNDTIEDTLKLRKKLTFPVRYPQRFLELAIVKNRQIRSIKLTNAWPLGSKDTKDLIEVFSNTVEKIHFAYKNEKGTSKLQREFFELILAKCNNIEELIVTGSEGQRPWSSRNQNIGLFGEIKAKIEIAAANKIQYIMIDVTGILAYRVQGITNLLLKLPHLKEIKLVGTCGTDAKVLLAICKALLEYLNKFKDGLQLKKLGLPTIDYYYDEETHNTLQTLLISCGKSSIVFDSLPVLDLDNLIKHIESSALDYSSQRPLFIGEFDACLPFCGGMQNDLDFLSDLNVRYMKLTFFSNVLPGQLRWIRSLPQLKALALVAFGQNNTASQSSIEEFENGLLAGLPSVKALELRSHVFGFTRVIRWQQDFPNLRGLSITCCKNTPNDIIAQLTVLESLSSLQFVGIQDLTDIAFTSDCINRNSPGLSSLASAVPTAPAVVCFKALTFLEIYCCELLTDACVINGIAKCTTLNELKISRCKEVTLSCLDNLDCDVFYLSSSYEKSIFKGKKNIGCCAFSESTKALC